MGCCSKVLREGPRVLTRELLLLCLPSRHGNHAGEGWGLSGGAGGGGNRQRGWCMAGGGNGIKETSLLLSLHSMKAKKAWAQTTGDARRGGRRGQRC